MKNKDAETTGTALFILWKYLEKDHIVKMPGWFVLVEFILALGTLLSLLIGSVVLLIFAPLLAIYTMSTSIKTWSLNNKKGGKLK